MDVEFIKTKGTWREVANSCNTTIGKEAGIKQPSSNWTKRIIMSEHSPIRQIYIKAKWHDLKSWVSVHITRHKFGCEHFVKTQRSDRTGIDRNKLPQDNSVEHEIEVNAQAIINISRKRLCFQASKETREAWQAFLDSFKDDQPELYTSCVKECVYRNGYCPEFKTCQYNQSTEFLRELMKYQDGFENQINKNTVITQGKLNSAILDKWTLLHEEYIQNHEN